MLLDESSKYLSARKRLQLVWISYQVHEQLNSSSSKLWTLVQIPAQWKSFVPVKHIHEMQCSSAASTLYKDLTLLGNRPWWYLIRIFLSRLRIENSSEYFFKYSSSLFLRTLAVSWLGQNISQLFFDSLLSRHQFFVSLIDLTYSVFLLLCYFLWSKAERGINFFAMVLIRVEDGVTGHGCWTAAFFTMKNKLFFWCITIYLSFGISATI